ncbi:hypothetical protein SDC9_183402 [bioreactor metagenome]|uniref:Uncharacterized protein n=1 Tax=bioreactor metagenome TaxID=1076179 RepID=A0A645HB08_9ZZZZ
MVNFIKNIVYGEIRIGITLFDFREPVKYHLFKIVSFISIKIMGGLRRDISA